MRMVTARSYDTVISSQQTPPSESPRSATLAGTRARHHHPCHARSCQAAQMESREGMPPFQAAKPAGSRGSMEGLRAAALPPRLEGYTRMALHSKNGILIEAGFVFGRKCTNRGFAALVVRMHEAKDNPPFANHTAMPISPLARCVPDSDPIREARRHRRGKKRRPLFGSDD